MDSESFEGLSNLYYERFQSADNGGLMLNYHSSNGSYESDRYQQYIDENKAISIAFDKIKSLFKVKDIRLANEEALLYLTLPRLIFEIKDKTIFKKATFSIDISDDIELTIDLKIHLFDFFRIKMYLDFDCKDPTDIFLSYKTEGKYIIRQGNYELIGRIINELQVEDNL